MTRTIGDYVSLQRGTTYKSALLGQSGPVLLGLGSIQRHGGFKGGNLKSYGGKSDPRMLLTPGDMYVSLKDVTQSADLLGAVARVPTNVPIGRLTQDTVKLAFKNENTPTNYIYWLLRTPEYRSYCKAHATGTTNLGLSREDFFAFPVPPLTAGRMWLLELLQYLDDKIELNQRMSETLEAMAQAIFRDWFVDFGPTRRKIDGATDPVAIMGGLVADPDRARELAELFPASMGGDGLPEGWVLASVSSVTQLLKRGLAPTYSDHGILVVNQKCVRDRVIDFSRARHHDAEKRPPRERLLHLGDVLVNSTGVGTLGRVATVRQLTGPSTADSHVTICRADTSKVSAVLLSLFLEGNDDKIAGMGHGSTGQTELSPASLGNLVLPIAPWAVQRSFESMVVPLRELSSFNGEQNRALAATRDLLLPKLMSGEIRLKQAQDMVEAAE